jgi:cyanate permease
MMDPASAPYTAMKPTTASQSFKLSYGLFAFFLVVANLRPALTSVGPLVETIRTVQPITLVCSITGESM